MPIDLQHAVIHSFDKLAETNLVGPIVKKQVVLNVGLPAVVALVDGVAGLLGKQGNSVTYGQFADDNRQGDFPPTFNGFTSNQADVEAFLELSHVALDELCVCAADEFLATGGHILVSAYRTNGVDHFLVAMIKQRGGVSLDAEYVPIEITEIDLSKVYQAARINVTNYIASLAEGLPEDAEERTYLCFLGQNKGNAASGYFVKALGCVKGVSSARATGTVLVAVQKFFSDDEGLKPLRTKARDAVVAYLHRMVNAGTLASLDDIVHEVSGLIPAEDRGRAAGLHAYLNDDSIKVPPQFQVHVPTLKRKSRIKGEDLQWTFQFEQQILGEEPDSKISYNRQRRALTINGLDDDFVAKIEAELNSR